MHLTLTARPILYTHGTAFTNPHASQQHRNQITEESGDHQFHNIHQYNTPGDILSLQTLPSEYVNMPHLWPQQLHGRCVTKNNPPIRCQLYHIKLSKTPQEIFLMSTSPSIQMQMESQFNATKPAICQGFLHGFIRRTPPPRRNSINSATILISHLTYR